DNTDQSLNVSKDLELITNEIIKTLQLNHDENKHKIIHDLLENGRQSLKNYEEDIIIDIYTTQMNGYDNDLMKLLKKYFEQQWNIQYGSSNDEWFILFLENYKNENHDWYEQVLTRTAEYGNKYTKKYPILSIILQLLFEGIDDQLLKETNIFNNLWFTITNNGLKSITIYSDYIIDDLINEQINNKDSILFKLLRKYYHQELFTLLKQSNILNGEDLCDLALDHLTEYGWKIGLQSIQKKTTPRHFRILLEKLELFLQQQQNEITTKSDIILKQDETSIISSFIYTKSNQYQFKNLLQYGEFQYLNQTFKDISEKLVDTFNNQQRTFPEFVQDCLTPIMFLLKRQQNLNDFFRQLKFTYEKMQQNPNNQPRQTTNISLRMLIHSLLMNSDRFLRRILMLLLSKQNFVPFISPNIRHSNENEEYEFMFDIIHVWNYTRPTILSFGIGPCQGKSTLLNVLFGTRFEESVKSIYFQQTIDIDFVYYCYHGESTLNIADTHGQLGKTLLRKIQSLFDGFLIQIDKTYLDQHPKIFIEYIKIMPQDKFQMIIVRDTSKENIQEYSLKTENLLKQSLLSLSEKLRVYTLENISNWDALRVIKELREQILAKINEIPINANRKDKILSDLQNLLEKDCVEDFKNRNKIIQPLKQLLLQTNQLQTDQNFPLYLRFKQLCKLQHKLQVLDFYDLDGGNMFEINAKLYKLECELDPNTKRSSSIKCGYVFDSFIEILKSENMLMSLDLLASELKSELLNLGGDKLAGNLAVEHTFLSLEALWRNSIVCYNHTTNDKQNLLEKSYYDFIAAGFPFEIIDGDTFHFQYQFLKNIFNKFASKRILVISIIGPQNSGKSLLLNYMFGTLFDVREGRCTRGIYGSLVKSNRSDLDYILLIDTEGLLSIEKNDEEYDRDLVLFCLAVSHLVIVNVIGEINGTLIDMLMLCSYALKRIGVNTTNQPIVHFVLNQMTDPNLQNHSAAIQKIIHDLKENTLAEVIDISSETFHALLSAFRPERVSTDTKSPYFLRPEPNFIECTQQLCEKIIESAKSSYERSDDMFSDPSQWLRTAVSIFDTLQKIPYLRYFKNIYELQQAKKIRSATFEFISITFTPTYRENLIKEISELTEREIQEYFQVKFDMHWDYLYNMLQGITKHLIASERFRDICRRLSVQQVKEICYVWCTAAIQAHDQKQIQKQIRDCSADLLNLLNDIIKRGKTMTKEKATQEFETMWSKTLPSIKNNFNPEEQLKQALIFVYSSYHAFKNICLPTVAYIHNRLPCIIELSQKQDVKDTIDLVQSESVRSASALQQDILKLSWKNPYTDIKYTFATIQNLKHLNRNILIQIYEVGINNQENYSKTTDQYVLDEHFQNNPSQRSSESNIYLRSWRYAKGCMKDPIDYVKQKPTVTDSTPLPFDFIDAARQIICEDILTQSDEKLKILYIPNIFDRILNETVTIINGNNKIHRPIETDLIQKILYLTNEFIHEINLELIVFKLSLSKQTISHIHTFILIILTIFYYDEQKSHFDQLLQPLYQEKSSLLTDFIRMVVPQLPKTS
ncbi:unnamed protein product, partial [Rotaria sordida]